MNHFAPEAEELDCMDNNYFRREPKVQSVSVCWRELCHVRCGRKKASFSSNYCSGAWQSRQTSATTLCDGYVGPLAERDLTKSHEFWSCSTKSYVEHILCCIRFTGKHSAIHSLVLTMLLRLSFVRAAEPWLVGRRFNNNEGVVLAVRLWLPMQKHNFCSVRVLNSCHGWTSASILLWTKLESNNTLVEVTWNKLTSA